MKAKGYIAAAIAAAAYGTNPAFAVPLYETGMNPTSVLLFRYLLSLPILAAMLLFRGRSLAIRKAEIIPLGILGILMGISSLTLFESYNYMNSGVASTLLFVYPILVAVMMTFFFHEKFKTSTGICLLLMGVGLFLLMKGEPGDAPSGFGFVLVMISSLTYALYLVMINVSKTLHGMSTIKLLFYVIAFGSVVFIFMIGIGTSLTLPAEAIGWGNLVALAVVPTIISLCCTTIAINIIGSTPTAIFGALEPVTAVILSVTVLNQGITPTDVVGGMLIVIATTLVIASDPVENVILRMRKMLPPLHKNNRHN